MNQPTTRWISRFMPEHSHRPFALTSGAEVAVYAKHVVKTLVAWPGDVVIKFTISLWDPFCTKRVPFSSERISPLPYA